MKVTRKVGRRSRYSVSRRRLRNSKNKKSGYKKRYGKTHKRGYWSGAKKGGARSRKYSHKRGKRFHRGGVDPDSAVGRSIRAAAQREAGKKVITDANGIIDGFKLGTYKKYYSDDNEVDVLLAPYDTNCVVVFKVKKKTGGFFPTQSQRFYCTLTFTFNKTNPSVPVKYSFALEREDDRNIKFSLSGEKQMAGSQLQNPTNQQILVEKLRSKNFLEQMKYFKDNNQNNQNNVIIYDFSDPANIPIFAALADIILNREYTQKAAGEAGVTISASANTPVDVASPVAPPPLTEKEQKVKAQNEDIPKAVEEIRQLGDDFETLPFDARESEINQKLNFGSFKRELIEFVKQQKQLIDNNTSFSDIEKKYYKSQIDELLLLLLTAQFICIKKIKINLTLTKKGITMIHESFISKYLDDMKKLTEDTRNFISNLANRVEQTYPFPNLKSSLQQFADKCKIKNISGELNEISDTLDKEQEEKLKQEIDSLSQTSEEESKPVVADTMNETETETPPLVPTTTTDT